MRLVLFDIDGTLLLTGGIGQRSARASLEWVFGTAGRLDEFYPGGRTIEAIFRDTLLDAGISMEDYSLGREKLYSYFLEEFIDRMGKDQHKIRALPGTLALVQALAERDDVILGLTTGNHERTARYKLSAAGFDLNNFKVGAYGDESAHRPDLIRMAKERAEALTGQSFDGRRTVMVGDTTRDVLSAREAGAVSIAVSSGTDTSGLLERVLPDHLLPTLLATDLLLEIILEEKKAQ